MLTYKKGEIEDVYAVCDFGFRLAVLQVGGAGVSPDLGTGKIVATLLFVVALPLLVVFAVLGALLPLLVPVALVAAAYGILKNYA